MRSNVRSGIYALACLDGRPLDRHDFAVLGLDAPPGTRGAYAADGFAVRAVEAGVHSDAVHLQVASGVLVFLGHLDERVDLAARLGLDPRTDEAALAWAAVDRFGDDAPAHALGEWSLLHWCETQCALTLVTSAPQRDDVFLATDGARAAVAPDLRLLARLDWVGADLDRGGVLLSLGRARLRRDLEGRTILRRVERLRPGATVRLGPTAKRHDGLAEILLADPPWRGGLDEAVAELERVLRRIVRGRLDRVGTVAHLLSGGLDSSLLTWLGSQERRPGQSLICLTSTASAGSNAPDEMRQARRVADHLGLAIVPVAPPTSADPYQHSMRTLRDAQMPLIGGTHRVYDALFDAAATAGADALLDGVGGELTVTSPGHLLATSDPLRRAVRALRRWRGAAHEAVLGESWPHAAFHVRLSPDALAGLEPELRERWQRPFAHPQPLHRPAEPLGFSPGVAKNLTAVTATPVPGLRRWCPFFDPRMVRLFAAMPAAVTERDGLTRAPARAMLRGGGLPVDVWGRTDKLPFAPDHRDRLRTHAAAARARIPVFEAAGLGTWFDLPWLARSLEHYAAQDLRNAPDPFVVQSTALAAEFLLGWTALGE